MFEIVEQEDGSDINIYTKGDLIKPSQIAAVKAEFEEQASGFMSDQTADTKVPILTASLKYTYIALRETGKEWLEEEEEGEGGGLACNAEPPTDPGEGEGQAATTYGRPNYIKGEPHPCPTRWRYYMGSTEGYTPEINGKIAIADWYKKWEYKKLIRKYGHAVAVVSGDVEPHSHPIEEFTYIIDRFTDGRSFSPHFEDYLADNYSDFKEYAYNQYERSGGLDVVYPVFDAMDLFSGMSFTGMKTGIKAFSMLLVSKLWLKGGRQVRKLAPEVTLKAGDGLINVSHHGEQVFKITDDVIEVTGSSVDDGAEIAGRLAVDENITIRTADGKDLTGKVDLVRTADGKVGWVANKGSRFIAKSGDELAKHLDELADIPAGKTYTGSMYRSLSKNAEKNFGALPDKMTDHTVYSSWGRYDLNKAENAMYLNKSVNGNKTEITHYGEWLDYNTYEFKNVKLEKLLDLSDDAVRQKLGTQFDDLVQNVVNKADPDLAKAENYEFTNVLASWARKKGYNGIIAPGARGAKDYENIILFSQSYIDDILKGVTPQKITK